MMKNMTKTKLLLTAAALVTLAPFGAQASESASTVLPEVKWSFDGPFGTYDRAALQRGLLVYRQVCASCHSMKLVSYRNLSALGYNEDEIKAIAAEYTVMDGPDDSGEMFERPARPSDKFKSPFANDKAAAAANNGAIPPDLSLITKARHGGANYVYGIMTGYTAAPETVTLLDGQYYNRTRDGGVISMPPPLSNGLVEYTDGTPQTTEQYAKDVSHFLTWAAEPEMEERKHMGVKVLLFLAIFAAVMYGVKRKVWHDAH